MNTRAPLLGALAFAIFAAACAATGGSVSPSGGGGGGGSTSTSSSGGASSTSSTSSNGSGGSLFDASAPKDGDIPDPDAACGKLTKTAKGTPADLYLAIDKSSSMAGDKWTAATTGINAFVNDPASVGLGVALNFFPIDGIQSCDQTKYSTPKVDYDVLPANASAISASLAATMPDGFSTPIYPALGGAINAAIGHKQNNPTHSASVILVTDGKPDGPAAMCGSDDPQSATAIANLAAAVLSLGVKTFVVGLNGVDMPTANAIATAGGTTSPIYISATNAQVEFQKALATVRGEALPCEYDLPDEVLNLYLIHI